MELPRNGLLNSLILAQHFQYILWKLVRVEVLQLVKVIQARSSVWQAVKEDLSVSADFRMTTNPVWHVKHHPSLSRLVLLFSGYFSSAADPATAYCQMKTGEDDECCPKADAF